MSDELDEIVDNLREPSSWFRIIFMVGFGLVLYLIIAPLVLVLMVVQALFSVITGENNYNLRRFGKALTEYVQQILLYLSYNSHNKPFPFDDFPELEEGEAGESGQEKTEPASKKTAAKKTASKKAKKAPKKAAKKSASKKSAASDAASSGDEAAEKSDKDDSAANKD